MPFDVLLAGADSVGAAARRGVRAGAGVAKAVLCLEG